MTIGQKIKHLSEHFPCRSQRDCRRAVCQVSRSGQRLEVLVVPSHLLPCSTGFGRVKELVDGFTWDWDEAFFAAKPIRMGIELVNGPTRRKIFVLLLSNTVSVAIGRPLVELRLSKRKPYPICKLTGNYRNKILSKI